MSEIKRLINKIEHQELVLPEFQREFTWNKDQVKKLIGSFLKDYPTGSLLFWKTDEEIALKNMPDFEFDGRIDVLLDGQQRLTTLYMLIKDDIPPYYAEKDISSSDVIKDLFYNLETEKLEYYSKKKMKNDPRWVRVTDCFKDDKVDYIDIAYEVVGDEGDKEDVREYQKRINKNLSKLTNIPDKDYKVLNVDDSCSLREALTVFDRINSQGTPLTKADIALAHMVSRWPRTRRVFKEKMRELEDYGYSFDLTFFVRSMNAVINHRAEYEQLHDNTKEELEEGFEKLSRILDYLVNILKNRAYVYSTDDLNTPNVLIPIIGFLSLHGPEFPDEKSLKKALYWMYAALYQTRFSGSVDTTLEEDLIALKGDYTEEVHPFDYLLDNLKEGEGDPEITKSAVASRGVGHPLYNMQCIVIRAKKGIDWANGIELSQPYGDQYSVERHHIFPRSVLEKVGYDTGNLHDKRKVHEIANRVPLTKSGNMDIFDQKPKEYLPEIQEKYPGTLEKFMIPDNEELWKLENYEQFLERRRELVAQGINEYMDSLVSGYNGGNKDKEITELVNKEEGENLEFKASLAWNLHAEKYTPNDLEKAVLKTITAFLNSDGGTLLIGVKDDKNIFGIKKDVDRFGSLDNYELHISNLIKSRIGKTYEPYIHIRFEDIEDKKVCRVEVEGSPKAAYLEEDNDEVLYIRGGNHTERLTSREAANYKEEHWD